MSAVDRFWARVEKTDTCWLWRGWTDKTGYGRPRINRRNVLAHRFAYELVVGPIPEGLQIDHLCAVPLCVNPAHLEPTTHLENQRRRALRQTHCRRAGHPLSGDNLRVDSRGRRHCRACDNELRMARFRRAS